MSNPDISVIVPVYNAQDGIHRCLDSLVKQTFSNFELILLNDGSTDNSLSILRDYESRYDFIKVIDKENEGVAKTRNIGIELANGKYLMFMDNDDFIEEDYLETFFNTIDQKDLDIVLGGYKRVDEQNQILFKQDLTNSPWSKYIIVAPWARFYRASFLKSNKIKFYDYPIGEDVIFSLHAYHKTTKIAVIDYNGYNWFFNSSSISNTTQKGFNPKIDIVQLLAQMKEVAGDSKYIKYFVKRYYIWYLLFSGRASTDKEFMQQYGRIKKWIAEEQFESQLTPFSKAIKGERVQTVIAVAGFSFLERVRMVSLFAKFYCKGKNK